ncbi:hypothetical protein ANCDUO_05122 [Ancylostoma duodenale]|uniref:Sodium:sulfate symporter transmembrane region n=1 Tax=Ancylostoma duodenale TaxID=51022 RepID=A0A0C2H587_9BILA|nr:hypothetical protein ANCDUO_05122 [Ancylostoma duodenale]
MAECVEMDKMPSNQRGFCKNLRRGPNKRILCSMDGFRHAWNGADDERHISQAVGKRVKAAYDSLGDFTFAEKSILGWFIVLTACWILRKPGFFHGWTYLFPNDGVLLTDSVPAILVVFILFAWPKDPSSGDLSPILNWSAMKKRFSWSCVLLIGAGYAISEGVHAESLHINPLYLALPVTLACSYSFMLPMSTPPNAVVYDTKLVSMIEMITTGLILNIFCILITVLNMSTWTYWLFDLGTFPDLTKHHNSTIHT